MPVIQCFLIKSVMNTRTSREPRHAICVVEVLLYIFNVTPQVVYEYPCGEALLTDLTSDSFLLVTFLLIDAIRADVL